MAFRRPKIALIGGGQIGGVIAQLCALRELGDVVMYDIVQDLPQGKTLDIAEAAKIDGFDVKVTGTNSYEDIKDSDLIIVTAGLPRKPGMSRDDLLTTNANIIKQVAENIKNMLQLFCYCYFKPSGRNGNINERSYWISSK